MKLKTTLYLFILRGFFICFGQEVNADKNSNIWQEQKQLLLLNFEENDAITALKTIGNAKVTTVFDKGNTNGKKALQIEVKAREEKSGAAIFFTTPISTQQFTNYSLVFDVTNITKEYSTQLFVTIKGKKTVSEDPQL
ncbi:hypothetical protein [Aquimarina agarivorans]|uniref:hypothetical protein n=1 Tax=Aquimarina agarivorans TaxID=980584 RepID=UPI000248E6A4|nr:hypothetical protein [Aquimarina agarivorans]